MKKTISLLSIMFFIQLFCMAQGTLQVNIKDCRLEGSSAYLAEFELFKDHNLVKTLKPEHESTQTIENLDFGKYRIDYKTIFGKTASVFFEISENKEYSVDLCMNYFNYAVDTYIPFISRIKAGESFSIQITSRGCFHQSEEKMEIERKGDDYYVIFGATRQKLSKSQTETVKHFEIELNYMESSGCTTIESYVLRYKSNEVTISDGSCDWWGFNFLKKKLNLLKE